MTDNQRARRHAIWLNGFLMIALFLIVTIIGPNLG